MKLGAAPLLLVLSCSSAIPVAVEPTHPRPAYRGPAVALFDDGIEPQPASAGFEPGDSPVDSALLRDRTQLADSVARVRVVTVTSTEAEGGANWQIGVHTLETLAGGTPAGTDWTLHVAGDAAAAGVLRALGGHLVQRPFILFLRTFAPARGDGGGALHFHLAGEDEDQLGAVRVAALLAQVK
jgi:hypothetical protein